MNLIHLKDILRPWLLLWRNNPLTSYSQMGEDIIIRRMWEGIGRRTEDLRYLDIGANHPRYLSVTYALYKGGARGVVVEPNPAMAPVWKLTRPRDVLVQAGAAFGKEKSATYYSFRRHTLNTFDGPSAKATAKQYPDDQPSKLTLPLVSWADLLAMGDRKPDLVSVDIEGLDEQLLALYPFAKHRPMMFCVESIAHGDTTALQGKTAGIYALMKKHGYFPLVDTYVNTVFMDKKVWAARPVS